MIPYLRKHSSVGLWWTMMAGLLNQDLLLPWKLTWHWNIPNFNRKYIFQWWVFCWHVSFLGGKMEANLGYPAFYSMSPQTRDTKKLVNLILSAGLPPAGPSFETRHRSQTWNHLSGEWMVATTQIERPIFPSKNKRSSPFQISIFAKWPRRK